MEEQKEKENGLSKSEMAIEKRILEFYENLPPGERALADLIMDQRDDFTSYSATELAQQASVSKATAARLFKRLGYKNFEEARRAARKVNHWGSPLKQLEARSEETVHPTFEEHLRYEVANLHKTYERANPQQLEDALDILATAQTTWVIGLRNSFGMAHYARFMLNMLLKDVRLVPQGGLSFAEEVLNMKKGDAMLVIGFRRRPVALLAVMKRAREIGVRIIYITDTSASQTAKLAEIVFRCHSRVPYLFDSYISATSLLNFIGTSLALHLGETGIDRLNRIDVLHDELDAFSHNKP